MKLLQIHYYFPPVKTVAALRLGNISRAAQHIFEHVFVLSALHHHRFPLEEQDTCTADIHRIQIWDFRRLAGRLLRREVSALSWKSKSTPTARWLIRLKNSFPCLYILGDGGLHYLLKGYRKAARLVQEEGITHILSSFGPWADHLIASRLKRRFPHLVWVADFRDPHADAMRRNVIWPSIQRFWARRVIRRADLLTTVSLGMQAYIQQQYGKPSIVWYNWCCSGPVTPVTFPGIDPADFIIGYTGSLYPSVQNPAPLLEALQEMQQDGTLNHKHIRLAYAGKDGQIWRQWMRGFGLEDILLDLGELPWREALALQQRAQLNLLLSWSAAGEDSGILTSKFFEYLNADKPILGLWNGPVPGDVRQIQREATDYLFDTQHDADLSGQIRRIILRLTNAPEKHETAHDGYRLWQEALEHTFLEKAGDADEQPPAFKA